MTEAVDERPEDKWFALDDENCDPDYFGGCVHCDEGMVMICPDDLCRATEGGCRRFDDETCFVVCPHCKGESI